MTPTPFGSPPLVYMYKDIIFQLTSSYQSDITFDGPGHHQKFGTVPANRSQSGQVHNGSHQVVGRYSKLPLLDLAARFLPPAYDPVVGGTGTTGVPSKYPYC